MQEINVTRQTTNVDIEPVGGTYHLPIASATRLGGIKVGNNLTIETDGTLNAESTEYTLPVATSGTLGGIKVGNGLSISDGSLSVIVDSVLNTASNNPVRNSAVSSSINTLTSGVQTNASNITNLNTTVGNLSTTVGNHTSSITTLTNNVDTIDGQITTITSDISDINTLIGSINDGLSDIDDRLDTAEENITTNTNAIADLAPLAVSTLTEITYSNLVPASTWTAGNIFVVKRGKVGFIYFDLEGSLTLAADASSVIYTFSDVAPAVKASATLLTDAGTILAELDDYRYELSLTNMSSSSMTITKVKGSIPLVFE